MRYLITLLIFVIALHANYCIQVMTTNLSDKRSILNEASRSSYRSFQDLRVESRGNYYVLRVGDYRHYNDSQQDLFDLRRIKRDAYVRTCDFNPRDAIYLGESNFRSPEPQSSYNRDNNYRRVQEREPSYNRDNNYRSAQDTKVSNNRNSDYRSAQARKTSYNRDNDYKYSQHREPTYKRDDRDNNYRTVEPREVAYRRDNNYKYDQSKESGQKQEKLSSDCKKCFVPRYKDGLFNF